MRCGGLVSTDHPPLRAVVVGVGVRGRDWVREVRSAPGYVLAGCVDIESAARERATQALSLDPALLEADTARALERWPCDVVIVSTPADDHAATCELALSRGRGVLVEKPFTTQLSDAVKLVGLAEGARRPLLVAHNYRHMRAFRAARRVIQDGRLGPLRQIHFRYLRVPHAIVPSLARLPHVALCGIGVHHLDLLRHLTGDAATGVLADEFTRPAEQRRGLSLHVLLNFASGLRATCTATYESSGHEYFERGQEFYARIVGERATLHIVHRWLVLSERGRMPRLIRRGPRPITEEAVLLDRLARASRGETLDEGTGRENLATMAMFEACIRSSAERRWVDPSALLRSAEA